MSVGGTIRCEQKQNQVSWSKLLAMSMLYIRNILGLSFPGYFKQSNLLTFREHLFLLHADMLASKTSQCVCTFILSSLQPV